MNRKYLDKDFTTHKLDVVISFAYQTRLWVSKINTSDGILFIEKNQNHLFVDSRYIEAARKNAQNAEIHLLNRENLNEFVKSKADSYKKIGLEKEYLTIGEFSRIKTWFKDAEFEQLSAHQWRILKTDDEVAKIQKAVDISLEAFEKSIPSLKAGMQEKEFDIILNSTMKTLGADKESFDSIIATGANSAMPHHRAGESKIISNDLLKIDFGALYKGYCADITRTIVFEQQASLDPKKLEIFQIVQEAAQKGRQTVKPGIEVGLVDKACRDYIAEKGYGDKFVHSTGHGVGIDIHELPVVGKDIKTILEPGMVITVEPGIYIEGFGGVRIEDVVLVTETGSKTLSRKFEIDGKEIK